MKLILSGVEEQIVEIENFVRDLLDPQSVLNFNLALNDNTATTIEALQSLYMSNMEILTIRIFASDGHMLYNFNVENGRVKQIKDCVTPDERRKIILTISFDSIQIGEIYTNLT